MRIAIRHLEVLDDLALVPDVVAGRHHVDAEIEKLLRQRRRDSEPRRGIFAVRDDQIRRMGSHQLRQTLFHDRPPRPPKNVTNKKNVQDQFSVVSRQFSVSDELGRLADMPRLKTNFDGITQKLGARIRERSSENHRETLRPQRIQG